MTWELATHTRPTARKMTYCETCGRQIDPGERYGRVDGKFDGVFQTYRECTHCTEMAHVWDIENVYEGGHGPDDFSEWEPPNVTGLRAKVYWRKGWRRPDGTFYPVPTAALTTKEN